MKSRHNLCGSQFGRWKVISKADKKGRHAAYLCRCECGTERVVLQTHLLRDISNSCGCSRAGARNYKWTGYGEISGNYWDSLRRGAVGAKARRSRRDRDFTITIEYIWDLFLDQNRTCALTGLILQFGKNQTASLDRINSEEGYVPGNVQWVHKDVNKMKNVFAQGHFIYMCRLVAENCEL